MDDWGRKVPGVVCLYGLECLELEKQGPNESSGQSASSGCRTVESNAGAIPSKYAGYRSAGEQR